MTEAINPGAGGSACQAGVRGQRLPPCRALRRATQQASAAVQTHTAAVRSDTMSIYAERDSVDGADSAVNTVGTVGDPHLLDQELVVPDYDDDAETAEPPAAPTDPAACIADFKAKREKHERWALAVILNAFLIANMGSMLLAARRRSLSGTPTQIPTRSRRSSTAPCSGRKTDSNGTQICLQ